MPENEGMSTTADVRYTGYAAISVIFFSIFAVFVGYIGRISVPYFDGDIFPAVFFLFGMVSFLGGALFLYRTADGDDSWYFRVPLIVSIAVVALSSFLTPALQVQEVLLVFQYSALVNAYIGSLAFILLAPLSALFFHSIPVLRRGCVSGHVVVSLAASLLSGLMLLGMLQGDVILFPHPGESLHGFCSWFYLLFGLPAIGIMFLVTSPRVGHP